MANFFYKTVATGLGIKHLTEKELCLDWFWKELKLCSDWPFLSVFLFGQDFHLDWSQSISWTFPNSGMIHRKNLKGPPAAPPQCHVSARQSRANWGTKMINQPLNKGELCPGNKKVASGGVPSLKLTSSLPPSKKYGWKIVIIFLLGKTPIFQRKKRNGVLVCRGGVFSPIFFL